MNRHSRSNARGFTVVELLISMAIMVGITAVIFSLADPAHGTYRTQPEVSDMQQRLRIGASFITSDLLMAGAGSPAGSRPETSGSLVNFFAPIQPVRLGIIDADPSLGIFFRDDAITVYYIPIGSPQTGLSVSMPQPSSELQLERVPGCTGAGESAEISCTPGGFTEGMRVIVFDETGAFDDVTVTEVQENADSGPSEGHLQHNKSIVGNTLSKRYEAGAQVAQVMQRTFYWDQQALQLKSYDGDQRDEVLADNVVELEFEYFGEPRPPVLITISADRFTNYGPRPPLLGATNGTTWPAGENCIFWVDPVSGLQVARPQMPDLAPGSQELVQLTEGMLTDGPWCPDAGFPNRFDADLLRVRKVGVRLRVQVASAALRGPAAMLGPGGIPMFFQPGTSSIGRNLVPDQDIRFDITPRNLNMGR